MRTSHSPRHSLLLGASLLALLVACGGGGGNSGGSSTPKATKLAYTNNASATTSDWRVEVDPTTNNSSKVTLNVFGPLGANVRGVTVFLTCNGTSTRWAQPTGATDPYALPGAALDLSQGTSVQMFKSRLSGNDLQVGAYQKAGHLAITTDHPIFSVALSLNSNANPSTVSPALTSGRTSIYLEDGGEQTLDLKLGTLDAQ